MKRVGVAHTILLILLPLVWWQWGLPTRGTYWWGIKILAVAVPSAAVGYFLFILRKPQRQKSERSRQISHIWRSLTRHPILWLLGVGGVTCLLYMLGALWLYSETGVSNDEATNLFHAKTFALGRLTNPTPPLPEFFHSFYILTKPVYIANSFPGYPAILMWGFLAGFPRVIPPLILLGSILATYWALLPIIGRPRSVLAALMFGTTIQAALEGTHYYSSAAIILFSPLLFGCVIRYTKSFDWKWAVASGAALAASFLARPPDAAGMGVVAALSIFIQMGYRRILPFKPALIGLCVFALLGTGLLLAYNRATVGTFWQGPYSVFFQNYCPESFWIHSPENVQDAPFTTPVAHHHRQYLKTSKGYNEYNTHTMLSQWLSWRIPLILFSLVPWTIILAGVPWVFTGRLLGRPAMALVLWPLGHAFYIFYAVGYQIVYSTAVTFALIGLGWFGLRRLDALARLAPDRRWYGLRKIVMIIGTLSLLIYPGRFMFKIEKYHNHYKQFQQARDALPEGPKLIFARYGPESWVYLELVQNEPILEQAETIIANDLGARNAELMARFPEREYYLYDEPTHKMHKFSIR